MKKKKTKLKPRTKLAATVDLLYPIDITKLGTDEDPCFGKLFDPKAPECMRCGDSEICQVVLAQNNHVNRGMIEKKGTFRDIEEKKIYDSMPSVKDIKAEIRKVIRTQKKVSKTVLSKQIASQFSITEKKVDRYIDKMLEVTDKFKISKNQLIWNN